jgi:DNA-binding PadR family transcriptional regulator
MPDPGGRPPASRGASRSRANALALAVLICLYEQPRHPYDVANTLRQRNKHESVKLNYGSLYSVIDSLERRGLIVATETERSGRLPERTVYDVTDAGIIEMRDWLTELISVPAKEYPNFEAALSFLPALPPEDVVPLLEERAQRLEMELVAWRATRELVERQELPRLFWVEGEYHQVMRQAELDYVRKLSRDISADRLEGTTWWRHAYRTGERPVPLPPFGAPANSEERKSPE